MKKNIISVFKYVLLTLLVFYSGQVYAETEIADGMYTIENNIYICDILQNTKIVDFKNNMNLSKNYNIYLEDNKQDDNNIIATGMILKTEDNNEYVISVKGDISSDGLATQTDLLLQKRGIIGINVLKEHEVYAIDINNDGKITATDLIQFKQFLVKITDSIITEKYIIINERYTIDLSDNNTPQITAKVIPGTANSSLIWSTSDADVLEVNNEGEIVAKKNGNATITVETTNKITATCEVKVQTTPLNIVLNATNKTLNLSGETEFQLIPTIEPKTANVETEITYTSSDTAVATVNSTGKITAVSTGNATITATTKNGKTANVTINVEEPMKDFSVSLADGYADYNYIKDNTIYLFYENTSSKKLDNGKTKKPSTLQLILTADNGSTPQNVTYESSNTGIFIVSETGELNATAKPSSAYTTAVRANSAKLTIKCAGITKELDVKVSCSSSVVNVSCDNGGWTNGTTTNKGAGHFQRCTTCYQCHRFHTLKTGNDVSQTRTDDKIISCSLCGGWISLN